MRRLILVRHGQTEWNRLGRIQGQTDTPLDDAGHAQAAALAPFIAGYRPVAIWTSDLIRAAATAARLAAEIGVIARPDERLRERSFGDLEGLSHREFHERAPRDLAAFRSGDFDQIPTAEPSQAATDRLRAAADDLIASLGDGDCGVIVSHGASLKLLVGSLIGLAPEASVATLVGMGNCAWAEIEVGGEPSSGGRLVAYNRSINAGGDLDFSIPRALR